MCRSLRQLASKNIRQTCFLVKLTTYTNIDNLIEMDFERTANAWIIFQSTFTKVYLYFFSLSLSLPLSLCHLVFFCCFFFFLYFTSTKSQLDFAYIFADVPNVLLSFAKHRTANRRAFHFSLDESVFFCSFVTFGIYSLFFPWAEKHTAVKWNGRYIHSTSEQ